MSITLFIRKGAARQRVKLSARAYYVLPNGGGKIDFTVATNCYVNRDEFNDAVANGQVMADYVKTDDGRAYDDFRRSVTSKCDAYVKAGGNDEKHLRSIIMGEVADVPKYFDTWWKYCVEQWEAGDANEFLCTKGKHRGDKVKATTLAMYKAYYKRLLGFIEYSKRIHILYSEVNQSLVNEIDGYLRATNYGGSSRLQFFTVLNLVARKAVKRGLLTTISWERPAIKAGRSENVKPVFVSTQRIDDLYNHKFVNKKLQEVADIFVVGALCGQRHSDYSQITSKDIVVMNGVSFLNFTQKKTSKHLYVPCDKRIIEILKRYGGQLPKVNIVSFDTRIKMIGAEMGWNEMVKVDAEENGMRFITKLPFYSQLGSHSARRSCLTNMYEAGVSLANIMRVSGHQSEAMLRKYLCLSDVDDANELLKSGYFNASGSKVAE